ncbi:metal-dependent hydrolase [Tepidibacter formicigenes]|jgi:L-ascorbate metabolism protein UlaG (beta-lactamase superfamily)|uniref:UPF0173 metal-dependent hydrolase SAMN02744037_01784 n=1 Tax=Tepidibacter formicigenes DSM 15518 TaxID=1123349 RepID=A0A1M6QA95_9FIRM|nr:metal-dependent hydrolase [Tepidibacter formicigenes]SHK17017.1 L-ascorbate metabolism protein UlaG, beta-lactamase superfamily [Tepidibacter formicigenes DSM 15518]
MKIKYLGHSAFFIQTDAFNILIDPYIKDNPICPISLNDLPKIDYILVTHGHSDHLGDTIILAKKHNSTIICNFEIYLYLSKYNIKCNPMHIGGKITSEFGKVKMTPALHGSSICEGTHVLYGGNPCGFLLEIEGNKIYHAGDTGLTVDMKLLEDEIIDLALLPIGGTFTMDIKDALKSIDFIKPKTVIPMHYNTFDAIKADPKKLKEKVTSCTINILKPGEELLV